MVGLAARAGGIGELHGHSLPHQSCFHRRKRQDRVLGKVERLSDVERGGVQPRFAMMATGKAADLAVELGENSVTATVAV